MGQARTSGGSLKFLIDNQRMVLAGWACDASCFSNNPQPDLQDCLGELQIKVEPLRFIVCTSSDLLQDAAFNNPLASPSALMKEDNISHTKQ